MKNTSIQPMPFKDSLQVISGDYSTLNLDLSHQVAILEADILDLKKQNEELKKMNAIAAHDLRAPLAVIVGFSELLSEELKNKTDDETLQHAERISILSRELLERIDSIFEGRFEENKPN